VKEDRRTVNAFKGVGGVKTIAAEGWGLETEGGVEQRGGQTNQVDGGGYVPDL